MFFRSIRALVIVYGITYLIMGVLGYANASQNFYAVDRHFALYMSSSNKIPHSIIKGSWCAIIAQPEFLERSDLERLNFSKEFFDKEISRLAAEQGYDVPVLRDWFLRYAVYDTENMPIKEYLLDWKGEDAVLYREIDLRKKPDRHIAYFFASKGLLNNAFWIAMVLGIPIIVVWFSIRNYLKFDA